MTCSLVLISQRFCLYHSSEPESPTGQYLGNIYTDGNRLLVSLA
jgi:hypothetical protein